MGTFADVLAVNGYAVHYRDAGIDDLAGLDPDLLIVLGEPIGANDEADYPFLEAEIALLESRLAVDRPTLGICLGAQLMAKVLGARVYPAATKEISWAPITLTKVGLARPTRHLAPEHGPGLHWHSDTFDLVDGAILLACTAACPNQASAYGRSALALQFHV